MSNRAFVFDIVFRVLLISAAFFIGFSPEAYAQVTGTVQGQLTSTEGRINFPFFYQSKVGDVCNPFVDYNCEITAAAASDPSFPQTARSRPRLRPKRSPAA